MIKLLRTLRLLLSTRTKHYEIASPLRSGGYVIYVGQAPTNYTPEED